MLKEEVGTKACIVVKLVKIRIKWAGHMIRMKDDKLLKISETKKQEGFRKQGKTTAKMMGGLREERSEKGKGGEKRPTTETNGSTLRKWAYSGVISRPASPLHKGTRGRTRTFCYRMCVCACVCVKNIIISTNLRLVVNSIMYYNIHNVLRNILVHFARVHAQQI